jgi:hypothetical protein
MVISSVGGGRLAATSQTLMRMIKKTVASIAEIAPRFILSNPRVSARYSQNG